MLVPSPLPGRPVRVRARGRNARAPTSVRITGYHEFCREVPVSGDMMSFVAVMVLLGVPVMGFTARFALKPIVEAVLRLRESFDGRAEPRDVAALQARVRGLEDQLADLQTQMLRIDETTRFHAQLGRRPAGLAGPGARRT